MQLLLAAVADPNPGTDTCRCTVKWPRLVKKAFVRVWTPLVVAGVIPIIRRLFFRVTSRDQPMPDTIGPARVGIIMGSQSDWETMREAVTVLEELDVPHEVRIVSAHRTPDRMVDYARTATDRGLQVIVAGAGGAAHLPGMVAAMTALPVLGVPVESKALSGMDSLLSIVQMPGGVPVGTLAIGKPGALNAGLMAASIVALQDPALSQRLKAWRAARTESVAEEPRR